MEKLFLNLINIHNNFDHLQSLAAGRWTGPQIKPIKNTSLEFRCRVCRREPILNADCVMQAAENA